MLAIISTAWAWLAGSRLGRYAAAAGLAVAAVAGVYLRGRSEGREDAQREAREADHDRAAEIRETAAEARADGLSDGRSPDDRLRGHGRLRD